MPEALHRTLPDADRESASQFSVVADTTTSTVRLEGELDTQTVCLLGSVIQRQIAQHHVHLTVDVAGLTFIDLAGFDALRDARRRLHERGGRLTITGYDPLFARVANICGMHEVLAGD